MVHFPSKTFKTDKAALNYVDNKTKNYRSLTKMSTTDIMSTEGRISLKKILEDIHVPLKAGDTVLVGKFKNHPIKVKKIGKGDDDMPTINGRPAVKFRLPKKDAKEGKLTEMPHGQGDHGAFDLQIERYPMSDFQKKALLQAYN